METTIAAISTAMSASGIGIVRISGEDAMNVISRIYRSKNGKKNIKEVKSHTIHYGYICDGEETVDEVLVMVMRGPKTYTGEDTVEIDCHGGVFAMKRVLETVLKNGAQVAEPGEFTKRAFLNGRLDLSQAEAVSCEKFTKFLGGIFQCQLKLLLTVSAVSDVLLSDRKSTGFF